MVGHFDYKHRYYDFYGTVLVHALKYVLVNLVQTIWGNNCTYFTF